MHLETKQRHWYILRSVNASFFQLKQLRFTFLSRTRLKPCLWNPGYMYLKYSVFNTPTFRIKMMKNWFVLMIQWLTHTSLVSLMDESVFFSESRMNDSITNTFFNSHLSPPSGEMMQSTQTLFEVGMADTSYFIFDPIPIFSSPVSSISIPIPIPVN